MTDRDFVFTINMTGVNVDDFINLLIRDGFITQAAKVAEQFYAQVSNANDSKSDCAG